MQYGISLSERLYPLLDICFYGQYTDESWFRFDKLYPFDTPVDKIVSDSKDFIEEVRNKEKVVKYVSWGVDSKVFVMNGLTNEVGHVGNILFLDFDDGAEFESILRKIAYLQRDKLIHSNPDIVKSEHGFHVYVYEIFDFKHIASILKTEYIYTGICNKFFRSTMYLKSSVLRLSMVKKGKDSRLEIIERGYSIGEIGNLYKEFVRKCLYENI